MYRLAVVPPSTVSSMPLTWRAVVGGEEEDRRGDLVRLRPCGPAARARSRVVMYSYISSPTYWRVSGVAT